jgi:transposase InsO family protein
VLGNAAAESFFAALENKMYHRQDFPTRAKARFAVADYIEVFYNRQRLHSTLVIAPQPRSSPNSRTQQTLHDQLPRGAVQDR